jgi:hypothetical protein
MCSAATAMLELMSAGVVAAEPQVPATGLGEHADGGLIAR